ncbi:hypothetical protein VSO49_14340 [Myroides odoratimimus]|uniref:hypothetical protein n=1 Tax=Myroides odoratimimus TaxID=76832 RepID=UPI002DB63951|nr:hypothetical protein [Myroides odoratimimus]MEC4077520.1 hypothetical protein [Myroides odoratimimus]
MMNIRLFILLTALIMGGSTWAKNKKPSSKTPEPVETVRTVVVVMEKTPVINFNDTLFNVYGNIGSFTSKQRAKSIEGKIAMLAEDYLFEGDSIKLADTGNYLNLMYQNEILMSVDSIQAVQESKSKLEAAQYYKKQIISAVELQQHNTSWQQILIQVAGTIAIIIVEYFILKRDTICL